MLGRGVGLKGDWVCELGGWVCWLGIGDWVARCVGWVREWGWVAG